MKTEVRAICVGQPRPFNGAEMSAIGKAPVAGPVEIRSFGIVGDIQADTKNHGGPEMAVHLYPNDHYGWWQDRLEGHDLLADAPAFGENLVTEGLREEDVHIGDRFRFGSALLEISQPRQPCWKIEHRFQRKGMVKAILQSHRCGWYFRVIEEGEAQAGDMLERVELGNTRWSVARVFAKMLDPKTKASSQDYAEIAALEALCERWRGKAAAAA